jgi:hypothetical protein
VVYGGCGGWWLVSGVWGRVGGMVALQTLMTRYTVQPLTKPQLPLLLCFILFSFSGVLKKVGIGMLFFKVSP